MLTYLPALIDRSKLINQPLPQLLTGAVLLSSWVAVPAVASPIAPATDGTGTSVTQEGNQFNINGGQLSGDGTNLFHSFEQFGLDANQIANFESLPTIDNILGRVVGGNASIINGLIQVTGGNANLFLINPAGIVFGANAQLNVTGDFTATTATGIGFGNGNYLPAIGEASWAELVGNPSFFEFGLAQPALVANFGNLAVPLGKSLSLFGGQVFNAGNLSAPSGNITMASVPGETVLQLSQPGHLLSLEITSLVQISPGSPTELGLDPLLLPDLLTGGENIDHANKIEQNSDGTIRLTGSGINLNPNYPELTVVANNLDVSGETGGNVQIFGDKIALLGSTIDADGTIAGGNVFVGGELQGQGTSPTAAIAFVSNDSVISANGLDRGNGGQVIVWADEINRFYGNVTATGGANGGDGGFVEISAGQNLQFRGEVDAIAPQGNSGTILIDPKNITIADRGTDAIADNDIFSENTANDVTFDGDDIARLNGEVILEANNDITVDEEIVADSVDNLEMRAGRSINVNANIDTSSNNGNITLIGNNDRADSTQRDSGSANIQMAPETILNAGDGNIELSLGSLGEVGTIAIEQLQSTGTVSLMANGGNIRRVSSDSLINARGAAFATNGEGGIGLELEPIRLDVDNLAATTGSGGAWFEFPNGGVTVGGVTESLTGISSTGGGDIRLETLGDITAIEDISTNVEDRENAGNITLSTSGAIDTTEALLSSTTETGDSGAIVLDADGAIVTGTIISRSGFDPEGVEIPGSKGSGGTITLESANGMIDSSAGILDSRSSGGAAGQIILNASDDILTGFILASSQGPSAHFSEGGIIEITSSHGSIDTTAGDLSSEVQITEDTDLSSANAIFSLFNSTEWANLETYAVGGIGGKIILSADGDITTSYVSTFGKKGGGQITMTSTNGAINTANLFSVSESEIAGNMILTTTDGAINTANLFSFSESGTSGDIILATENNLTTANIRADSTQGSGGEVDLTALGSISTSDISTDGAIDSGNVTINSGANSVQTGAITTAEPTANTTGDITINFYETTGNIQSAELSSVGDVQTIIVTNEDGSAIIDSNAPTNNPDDEPISIEFPVEEEIATETTDESTDSTDSDSSSSESIATTDSEVTDDSNSNNSNSSDTATTTDSTSSSTEAVTDTTTLDNSDNSVNDSATTTENYTDLTAPSDSDPDTITNGENPESAIADSSADSSNVSDVQIPTSTEYSTPSTEDSTTTTTNESNTQVETIATTHGQTVAVTESQESVTRSQQTSSSQITSYYSYSQTITISRSTFTQTSENSQQVANSNTTINPDRPALTTDTPTLNLEPPIVNEVSNDRPLTTATVPTENPQTTPTVDRTIQADSMISNGASNPSVEVTSESANTINIIGESTNSLSSDRAISTNVDTMDNSIGEPAVSNSVDAASSIDEITGIPVNPAGFNPISVNPATTDLLDNEEDDDDTDEDNLEAVEEPENLDSDESNTAAYRNEPIAIELTNDEPANSSDSNDAIAGDDSQGSDSIPLESESNLEPEFDRVNSQAVISESTNIPVQPIKPTVETISSPDSTNQTGESSTDNNSGDDRVSSPGTRVSFNEAIALERRRQDEFEEYLGLNLENQFITAASAREILGTLERQTNQKAAVVYMTANSERLELIMFTAKGEAMFYSVPAAKRDILVETIQNFILEINFPFKRKTTSYLPLAQQLYQWLIAPIEATLENEGIDTILFSMDAGLRSLPIAALHDGNRFLIEKYSLSLIPSVSLIDPRYTSLENSQILAMGADTFPDMNPLPAVPVELEIITEKLPGTRLLNQEFTPENLRQLRQQNAYDIVHLATHADFIPGPIDNAFIYFWNQKLNLDDLRDLGLQNPAAELLVLSACRTALGDPEAELGFAGLAIRTGVKSALASLWYVDDIGTLGFMTQFYQHLSSATIKAEALRQTQIAMIREEIKLEGDRLKLESAEPGGKDVVLPATLDFSGNTTFSHPYYWAGFTMIGSPW